MKRKMNLRTLFLAAFAFAAMGLYAQIPGWDNGAGGNNYDTTGTTYVTVGKDIPLYAHPDLYYHPSWDPAAGTGLTAGFTWAWTVPTNPANVSLGGASANYVVLSGVTAGSSVVNVVETAPVAWGSCADAGRDININVVAEPAVAYTATSVSTAACEGGTFPAAIEATISGGYQAFRLAWTLEIKSTDASAVETWYDDEDGLNPAGAQKYAVEWTLDDAGALPGPDAVAAAGDHDLTTVAAFNAIDGETTEYIYSLNGVNDQASRWGDFLTIDAGAGDVNTATAGDFVYYNTVAQAITITVYPTPTTGPIFHIDAGWAN